MRTTQTNRPVRRRFSVVVATAVACGALATGMVAASPTSPALAADETLDSFTLVSYQTELKPLASVAEATPTSSSTAVTAAIADAESVLASAGEVTKAAAADDLEVEGSTAIDTDALSDAVAQLDAARDLPAPFVPSYLDRVAALTDEVDEQVTALDDRVDAAKKRKAEEQAAEKARAEAEAAKAAEAAAQSSSSGSSGSSDSSSPAPVAPGGGASPAEAQSIASGMLGGYGWGGDQFGCLVNLWNKESGWNYQAYNPSSGAFGIPQALPGGKMASAGADWQTSAATQIRWGLGYIQGRYGSPCAAWGHSQAVGWY